MCAQMILIKEGASIDNKEATSYVLLSKGPDQRNMLNKMGGCDQFGYNGPRGEPSHITASKTNYETTRKESKGEVLYETRKLTFVYTYNTNTGKMKEDVYYDYTKNVEPVKGFTPQQAESLGLKPKVEPQYNHKQPKHKEAQGPGFFERAWDSVKNVAVGAYAAVSKTVNAAAKWVSKVIEPVYNFFDRDALGMVCGTIGTVLGLVLATTTFLPGLLVAGTMLALTSSKFREGAKNTALWIWNDVINGPWGAPVGLAMMVLSVPLWGLAALSAPAWLTYGLGIGGLLLIIKTMPQFVEAIGLGPR